MNNLNEEISFKINDKISFKIPSNYPMNSLCIHNLNKKEGKIIEILNEKVGHVKLNESCLACHYKCDFSYIQLKYLNKGACNQDC